MTFKPFVLSRAAPLLLAAFLLPQSVVASTCSAAMTVSANVVERCSVNNDGRSSNFAISCATVLAVRIVPAVTQSPFAAGPAQPELLASRSQSANPSAGGEFAVNHVACAIPLRSASVQLTVIGLPSKGVHKCQDTVSSVSDLPRSGDTPEQPGAVMLLNL